MTFPRLTGLQFQPGSFCSIALPPEMLGRVSPALEDTVDGCEGMEGAPIWLNGGPGMFREGALGQSVKVFRGSFGSLPSPCSDQYRPRTQKEI